MRILLLHPNYHSGGAEIAGNWPPAWVAYLAGALRQAGYHDLLFIDAMTENLSDEQLRERLAAAVGGRAVELADVAGLLGEVDLVTVGVGPGRMGEEACRGAGIKDRVADRAVFAGIRSLAFLEKPDVDQMRIVQYVHVPVIAHRRNVICIK